MCAKQQQLMANCPGAHSHAPVHAHEGQVVDQPAEAVQLLQPLTQAGTWDSTTAAAVAVAAEVRTSHARRQASNSSNGSCGSLCVDWWCGGQAFTPPPCLSKPCWSNPKRLYATVQSDCPIPD